MELWRLLSNCIYYGPYFAASATQTQAPGVKTSTVHKIAISAMRTIGSNRVHNIQHFYLKLVTYRGRWAPMFMTEFCYELLDPKCTRLRPFSIYHFKQLCTIFIALRQKFSSRAKDYFDRRICIWKAQFRVLLYFEFHLSLLLTKMRRLRLQACNVIALSYSGMTQNM